MKIKNGTKHANFFSGESDDVIWSKTVNFYSIDILMPISPSLQLLFWWSDDHNVMYVPGLALLKLNGMKTQSLYE